MVSDSWFYSDGDNSFGPVDEGKIECLIADGTIGASHFVMPEGEENWTKASESLFASQFEQIWYHSDSTETYGPVSESDLHGLIESGEVAPDHFVMRASETDWSPLSESKFASIKIKGPKIPSGPVNPEPLRRQQPSSPSRPKVEVRTDVTSPTAPKKDDSKKSKRNKRNKASVPAAETQPTDKIAKLTEEIEAVKKESDSWMRRVAEAERDRGDALKECQETTKTLSSVERQLAELNKQFELSVTEAAEAQKETGTLRENLKSIEKKLQAEAEAKAALKEKLKGSPNAGSDATGDSEQVESLSSELHETSSFLSAAKELNSSQAKKIDELQNALQAALAKATNTGRVMATTAPAGAADQKRVWALEESLEEAKKELLAAKKGLAETEKKLHLSPAAADGKLAAPKSLKLPWVAALVSLAFAAIAGVVAWNEHKKYTEGGDLPAKLASLETELLSTKNDLEETRENLERARSTETSTGEHAAFTSTLLDRIAALSGPVDPDLIAQMRRETEKQFGLSEKTDPRDTETAKRAAEKIAKGDAARLDGKHEDAGNSYRDAGLMLKPLLEKYPSKVFWRGDLVTAYTRQAMEELELADQEEADEALAQAEAQFEILQNDDPGRAAVRTGELADTWERLGDDAAKSGDIDRAQSGLDRALQLHAALVPEKNSPAYLSIQRKLGDVAADGSEWQTADHHYQIALAKVSDPLEKAELQSKSAQVKRKLGQQAEAMALATDSLAYFRTTAELDPTPGTLRPLADTFNLTGEIKRDSGDFEGAKVDHAQAEAIYKNILTAEPDDFETKRGLAISGVRAGEVEMAQKNYAAARIKFEENLPTFRMLTGPEFSNIPALKDLEYVHLNIARSYAMENDHDRALEAYSEALRTSELLADAAPKNPAYSRQLASWKKRVADYQKSLGKLIPARENLQDALRIQKVLAANSEDPDGEITKEIAELNKALGDLEMAIVPEVGVTPEVIDDPETPAVPDGGTDEVPTPPIEKNQGEAYYRDAIAEATKLSDKYPEDPNFRRQIAEAHENLVIFLITGSRIPDAQTELEHALTVRKKLVEDSDSPEPLWLYELSRVHYQLGYITSQTSPSPAVGEQHYIAALDSGESAVQATDAAGEGVPAEWIAQNGETYLRLGEIDMFEREYFPARRRLIRAAEILRRLTAEHGKSNWKMSFVLSCLRLAENYEISDPKDPTLAKNLYTEGFEVLQQMEAAGELEPDEKQLIAVFKERTER